MPTERLPMRRIREILRLRRERSLSVRETARALGVSVGVVSTTASRAAKAGVNPVREHGWRSARGRQRVGEVRRRSHRAGLRERRGRRDQQHGSGRIALGRQDRRAGAGCTKTPRTSCAEQTVIAEAIGAIR